MTPRLDEIERFVVKRFGSATDVSVMHAGAWSSAYSFQADGRELVLRLGRYRADFDKELAATAWRVPGLPVPEVLELGEAFDRHYVVSSRNATTAQARRPGAIGPRSGSSLQCAR